MCRGNGSDQHGWAHRTCTISPCVRQGGHAEPESRACPLRACAGLGGNVLRPRGREALGADASNGQVLSQRLEEEVEETRTAVFPRKTGVWMIRTSRCQGIWECWPARQLSGRKGDAGLAGDFSETVPTCWIELPSSPPYLGLYLPR